MDEIETTDTELHDDFYCPLSYKFFLNLYWDYVNKGILDLTHFPVKTIPYPVKNLKSLKHLILEKSKLIPLPEQNLIILRDLNNLENISISIVESCMGKTSLETVCSFNKTEIQQLINKK